MTPPPPDDDGFKWVVFSDSGNARLVHGYTITQAISNWRKSKRRRGEPVGIIKCGYSENLPGEMHGTDVFGVVCCVHRPG